MTTGYTEAELNAIKAGNIGGAVMTGIGGSMAGEALIKRLFDGVTDTQAGIGGDIGGNVGGLALQLIVQGATGQLDGKTFAEDIKSLIISEAIEKALTALGKNILGTAGAGPIAALLMVLQIGGAILDAFWDPFKAVYQEELDALHEKYQRQMRSAFYDEGYKWPLIVKPDILPTDDSGVVLEPVQKQVAALMKEYLDARGLVTVKDLIQMSVTAEVANYREIALMSNAAGTLIGSTANVAFNAEVVVAKMVLLLVKYRQARETIAKNVLAREQKRKAEKVKWWVGIVISVLLICCSLAVVVRVIF